MRQNVGYFDIHTYSQLYVNMHVPLETESKESEGSSYTYHIIVEKCVNVREMVPCECKDGSVHL